MFADVWLNLNALVFIFFPKDHLLGVEVAMRELGCGESMALAGLFPGLQNLGVETVFRPRKE